MIQRTGGGNVDVEFVRRHNGSSQQDVEYVRRYDNGTWKDVWPEDEILIAPGKTPDPEKIMNVYRYYYESRDEIRWHVWRTPTVTSYGLTYSLPTTKNESHWGYAHVMTAERIDISKYNTLIFECMVENVNNIVLDGDLIIAYGFDSAMLSVIQDQINIMDTVNPPVAVKTWTLCTNEESITTDPLSSMVLCTHYVTYAYIYSNGNISTGPVTTYHETRFSNSDTSYKVLTPIHFEIDISKAKQYVNGPCHIGVYAYDRHYTDYKGYVYGKSFHVTKFALVK